MPRLPIFRELGYPLLDPTLPIFQELNTTSLSTSKLFGNKNGWHPGKNPAAVLKNERNRMLFHLGAFFNFIFQAVNLYAPPQISGLGRGDSFRIKRIIWPAVAVFCSPQNIVKCSTCGEKPVGDYFHNFSNDADMCRQCMHVEMAAIKKCNLQVTERYSRQQKIKQFVPARYCGFFHDHNQTTATIERDSRKVLRQKIRVENYLYRLNAKIE